MKLIYLVEYRIGCSGWSYKGWLGTFYPSHYASSDFLRLYSSVFETVEIDSTFYRIPGRSVVEKWRDSTPDGFLFSPKVPGEITHERKLKDADKLMEDFISTVQKLGGKLGPVLLQLPPSFAFDSGWDRFRSFIETLPEDVEFGVEFRNETWFRNEVYQALRRKGLTLVWADAHYTGIHPELTSQNVYLRLVGDRSIPETEFGRVVKNRTNDITEWASRIDDAKDDIERAFVFSNNHFQGFSPATVNEFRNHVGLEPVDWEVKMKATLPDGQKKLF